MTTTTDLRWQRAHERARAQHGLITHPQLLECGFTTATIRSAVDAGLLKRLHRGVYKFASNTTTPEQVTLAACLAAGRPVAATHRAATHVWEMRPYPNVAEVSVPTPRHPKITGAIVHRVGDLARDQTTVRKGIPVTKPARTLLDLASVVPFGELQEAVDRATVRGLTNRKGLLYVLKTHPRHGRPGREALVAAIDALPFGDLRPESVLEPVMGRILRSTKIGDKVKYQHEVMFDGRKFRFDFGFPHVMGAVEVHGLEHHASDEHKLHDIERRRLAKIHGWDIIEYVARDMKQRPAQTARDIERWVLGLEQKQGQLWVPPEL